MKAPTTLKELRLIALGTPEAKEKAVKEAKRIATAFEAEKRVAYDYLVAEGYSGLIADALAESNRPAYALMEDCVSLGNTWLDLYNHESAR